MWFSMYHGCMYTVKTTGSGGRDSANYEGGKLIEQDRDSLF